ncbi:MAG: LysM peptidoglycan-binding domain-containing protein [Bacteroidetes bacterium]|nr:MAG: LysM peptidoglycan-binding domain-containing protein [Bacteroidota bacterium]MBL1145161.1 LysM peptidoglycan-binding domain-containing protein [Bacteroidota bacterium]NOG57957.1 LysM peptidoglycan-binding domain-containing protein [Bacteroidota bacterium]
MRLIFLFCSLFISTVIIAQPASKRITRSEYINLYKDDAIREMHRSGVPASITLAQGILESGDGNSALARYANNHFGIKCHSDWTGKTFIQDDDSKDECFRKYKHVLESFHDHSEFLQKKRYAFLFEYKITDYKAWAHGLKKAGYATNPKYPQLLIKIIEENNLAQYDTAKASKSKKEKSKKENSKNSKNEKPKRKGSHEVLVHENNIRYIIVKPEDSFEKIADEFQMGLWQLYKYNDLDKEVELFDNGVLFLQPKRAKAKEDLHIVGTGETMWDISQKYGIKLSKLYKKNRMNEGEEPNVGDKIYMRGRKPQ